MSAPNSTMVIIPTHDGNICSGTAKGLFLAGGLYRALSFVVGLSHVSCARNVVAAGFLSTPFDTLVCIDADMEFSREDFELLMSGTEKIVCAEYSKKTADPNEAPASFGMGFVRIHRSVFEDLRALKQDDGRAMVGQYFWRGELVDDFFPSGPDMGSHWMSEDHGFFHLCRLAQIETRLEKRTKLIHWGRMGYAYRPRDLSVNDASPAFE